jgi:hypothetical protein
MLYVMIQLMYCQNFSYNNTIKCSWKVIVSNTGKQVFVTSKTFSVLCILCHSEIIKEITTLLSFSVLCKKYGVLCGV